MRLLLAATALASTQARPDEGYLFVTNRGDEAVLAARSVRAVSPRANITFVSDAATLSDQPTATAAELERLLPSHFLRLSRHHRGRDGPRRRAPAKVDRAREAAFVAANVADAAFYELAREAFMGRRLACHSA